ncbi:double-CXXCG motif protein [Archangium violaceum]|uniref:double-CXXCG motif protein n=1 Tax=Archangium violaceum TaxID=83451 RepID=UPI001EF03E91|nr:double-CXXCG motif protein [Archangium violaceum]
MVQREALEKLQTEGLRGLEGCRTLLRFRQRQSPELLELEILRGGRLHPDCLPTGHQPPCPRCGRRMFALPTVIVCTERFVDVCQHLGLDGTTFRPLATRASRSPRRR